MPKILRIHNRLIMGGPTPVVLNLTKFLQPDFETLLIVGEKEFHEQDAMYQAEAFNIKPIVIPGMGRSIHPFKDFATYREIKKIIKSFKPDIVHTHAAKPGAVGRLAAIHAGVPCVLHTYHGHVFHSYFSPVKTKVFLNIERTMARRTDKIIAISPGQLNELSKDFRIAPLNKFAMLEEGFDLSKFSTNYQEKRKQFRDEFLIDDRTIVIGTVGRVVAIKNLQLFVKALSAVLQHTNKKVKAFIVGDGDARDEIEALAASFNIAYTQSGKDYNPQAALVFTSWRTDVDAINAGLDIVCLSSLNEGTPVSLIEAQAANTPIISTNVGGVADIVMEGETALLSSVNDENKFIQNLLQIVEDDKLRWSMSQKGNKFVHEKFSIQRMISNYRNLYYELLNKK